MERTNRSQKKGVLGICLLLLGCSVDADPRLSRGIAAEDATTSSDVSNSEEVTIIDTFARGPETSVPTANDCSDSNEVKLKARVWRLTHSQYDATIQDLLGIDPEGRKTFEAESGGTAADALTVSLGQASLYLDKSVEIAERATENLDELLGCSVIEQLNDDCVREFIEGFGKKAWRKPLSEELQERLFSLYREGARDGSVRDGVKLVIQAIINAPQFLYRQELGERESNDGVVKLSSYEVATQLSYLLIGSTPDDELLRAADQGLLTESDAIVAQTKRLLASPRAQSNFSAFFLTLLDINGLDSVTKDVDTTLFNPAIARDMQEEVRRFIKHVTWEAGGRIDTLLTAPYTFVNPRLARLYGVESPTAQGFAKVDLDPNERAGLLTQLGVLTATADASETNPLHRGLLVRQKFLCQTLPAPPPEAVEAGVPAPRPDQSTRERFAKHSSDKNCAGCHKLIDPIGFSMENFDEIGRFRLTERGFVIDNSGEMHGTRDINGSYSGSVELAHKLSRSAQVSHCITEQYYESAFGTKASAEDQCSIKAVSRSAESSENQLLGMIFSLVESDAFILRQK